jgi:hypothetical protein
MPQKFEGSQEANPA